MKLTFITIIFLSIFSFDANCQSTIEIDKEARIKFSVHLMDYFNPPTFENALGEAYYNAIKFSFSENLIIPDLELNSLSANDKEIIVSYIDLLSQSVTETLTWPSLIELEKQYLIWVDRSNRKVSKYKN
jgi:hypothetical protein